MDTSTYTHVCQAGYEQVLVELAPGRIVLVPRDVDVEIENRRRLHPGIPATSSAAWVEVAVLTEEEVWVQADIKAQMGGDPDKHLGEAAVIACASHRSMVAVMDERAAILHANRLGVPTLDTMWIVIEAYKELFGRDRDQAAKMVDALLETGLFLPIDSGDSVIARAYEEGLLP